MADGADADADASPAVSLAEEGPGDAFFAKDVEEDFEDLQTQAGYRSLHFVPYQAIPVSSKLYKCGWNTVRYINGRMIYARCLDR